MTIVGTLFPLANDARNGARNNVVIFNEVTAIQKQILDAIAAGKYSITILNTNMTQTPTGEVYYNVWQNLLTTNIDSTVLTDQMNQVSYFFSTLGYSIAQLQNETNDNLFVWRIQW